MRKHSSLTVGFMSWVSETVAASTRPGRHMQRDSIPSVSTLSLPDRLSPVYDGMLRAAGLCAILTGCLMGNDARKALILKDILMHCQLLFTPLALFSLLCVRLEASEMRR